MVEGAGGLSGGGGRAGRVAPGGVARGLLVLAATAALAALLGRFLFYPMVTSERPDSDTDDTSDLTFQFSDLVASSPGDGKRSYDVYVGRAGERGAVDPIDRPRDGGAGPVAGPAFAPWDEIYPFTDMGLGFGFRAPPDWGCTKVTEDGASDRGAAAIYCADVPEVGPGGPYSGNPGDETGYVAEVLERPLLGPGPARGFITVEPCRPEPCGSGGDDRPDPRVAYSAGPSGSIVAKDDYTAPVKRPDPTTAYVEQTENSEMDGLPRYLISITHLYNREGDGEPDTRVVVTLAGPPEAQEEMQKIVNDVREATP